MYSSGRTTMLGEIPKKKLRPVWKHHVALASIKWRNTENLIIDCLERCRKFQPRLLGQVQENCRKSKDRPLEKRYRKNTENLIVVPWRNACKIQKISG
jgi:hypothetical protein